MGTNVHSKDSTSTPTTGKPVSYPHDDVRKAGGLNPDRENEYWEGNYSTRPYAESNRPYSDYEPAYRYGWESQTKHSGRSWDDVQNDLEVGWEKAKGKSALAWHQAKSAVKDAWHRVERALPGDADGDGN